jgi:hypothetical protein
MKPEFNFVGPGVHEVDILLFMGPMSDDDGPFLRMPDNWSLAHVMHHAGLFPSVGQAKKNGWDKPIEPGFSHFVVTKRKIAVWILTRFEGCFE